MNNISGINTQNYRYKNQITPMVKAPQFWGLGDEVANGVINGTASSNSIIKEITRFFSFILDKDKAKDVFDSLISKILDYEKRNQALKNRNAQLLDLNAKLWNSVAQGNLDNSKIISEQQVTIQNKEAEILELKKQIELLKKKNEAKI